MKVLIVNTSDIVGGAARAAYRLHRALRTAGVDSWMLVQNKVSDDYTVIGPETKLQKALAKIRLTLDQLPVKFYKHRTKTLFSPAWLPFSKVIKKINEINPDIVHLHWICGGMLRIEDLAKIKKPIVWSLHDNWAFTGGCHIMWDCTRYKEKCGKCPRLGSKKKFDLSRWVWLRKYKTFKKIDKLIIVGLSKWICERAKESSLLQDRKIVNLPNPIDVDLFKPLEKNVARAVLNLPLSEKLIGFGVLYTDPNKGFELLFKSLNLLDGEKELGLVIFGYSEPEKLPEFKIEKVYYLGRLSDDVSLTILYNALDVIVVPSLQETLSNTIMESLSCGTPVVAFDVGGNSDMIDHKVNGYLAKPFDTEDLANGIKWVLNNPEYDKLRYNARKKVVENFDSRIVAQKYIDLYKEILNNS